MSTFCKKPTWTFVTLLLLGIWSQSATSAEPVDVSYISSDAVGALVLHPRQLLTNPQFEMLPIEVVTAAGLETFGVDPLDIEEAVCIFGLAGLAQGEPGLGAVLRFAKPYDNEKVLAKIGAPRTELISGEKKYFRIALPGTPAFCVHLADAKTIVLGNEPQIRRMLTAEDVNSPLVKLLKKTDTSKSVVAVLDFATVRPLVMLGIQSVPPLPEEFEPFLELPELVKSIEASIDIKDSIGIAIRIDGNDEAAAVQLKELAERAKRLAREMLLPMIVDGIGQSPDPVQQSAASYVKRIFNKVLDDIKLEQKGDALHVTMIEGSPVIATSGVMVALLLPAVQSAREAARRAQSMNNMKQMGLAMHNYLSVKKTFPARAIRDKDGKALLSWRVAILPYMENFGDGVSGEELYKQFHLDEPWDSEHNRKLLAKIPAIFANPNGANDGRTNYLAAAGKHTIFGGEEGVAPQQITDGLSNSIMVVEVEQSVPWTKPEDLEYDSEQPKRGLGTFRPGGFLTLMADGSVRVIMNNLDVEVLQGLMTKDGGEPVSLR